MARHYKKWEDHSQRWQREQSRKGLDKKRWNGWLKLSEKTRRTSNPVDYAVGKGVAAQRRERKEAEAVRRIKAISPANVRLSTVKHNVKKLSDKDLDWTLKASEKELRKKAAAGSFKNRTWVKPSGWEYATNPWWYR